LKLAPAERTETYFQVGSLIVKKLTAVIVAAAFCIAPSITLAAKPATFAAPIFDTTGKRIGMATFVGVDNGTQVTVDVTSLAPGLHGLHLHEFGSCNPLRDTAGVATPFGAAGGHFDPMGTKMHKGPDGGGHAGDMPVLHADANGSARLAFFDSAVSVTGPNSIVGRSIVIHALPDNYTDTPPNGGSGGRVACGEINAPTS